MMQPGEYYVGDLCYVMKEDWDEFCSITIQDHHVFNGEFSLADGRKFAFTQTAYGDGSYPDQYGNYYDVDAGLIGCIRIEDIRPPMPRPEIERLGNIFTFHHPFEVEGGVENERWDGIIVIGHLLIDTDPKGEEDEVEDEV